ncbi:MAG: hypothetical protein MUE82_06875 [Chloroflexi bacterium]|jgi:hypothetical protein|nr:hypothetical protein [Chloroflexota bacterium]
MHRRIRALIVAAAGAAILMVGPMAGTVAAHDAEFPAGVACDFALAIDFDGAGPGAAWHEWYDADGNLIRTLGAGTGWALTFTNEDSGASLSTPWNGSVMDTRYAADGTQTISMKGHMIVIMFPTDVPAGPSTTLYVGRVVLTVSPAGVSTIISTAGRAIDICAALD